MQVALRQTNLMKRNIILFTALAGTLYFSLTSYGTGPGSRGAGHVAATGCGNGCHGASSSANTHAMISILRKSDNQPVTDGKYTPGTTYVINVMGHNASLTHYGYQLSATSGSSSAGTLSNPSSGSKLVTAGGIRVAEHSAPITGSSSGFTATIDWQAPPTGTGNVTLNLAVNAVNNNGGTLGDAYNTAQLALSEATTSVDNIAVADIKVYPNPATNQITVDLGNKANYTLYIADAAGRTVLQNKVTNNNRVELNTSGFQSGLYSITIMSEGMSQSTSFVKQ